MSKARKSYPCTTNTHETGTNASVEKEVNEEGGGEGGSKTKFKVIPTNFDGFTSKKQSFDDIINNETPDVIGINGTAPQGNSKGKILNHFSYTNNGE